MIRRTNTKLVARLLQICRAPMMIEQRVVGSKHADGWYRVSAKLINPLQHVSRKRSTNIRLIVRLEETHRGCSMDGELANKLQEASGGLGAGKQLIARLDKQIESVLGESWRTTSRCEVIGMAE
jgi:hypothetical protein